MLPSVLPWCLCGPWACHAAWVLAVFLAGPAVRLAWLDPHVTVMGILYMTRHINSIIKYDASYIIRRASRCIVESGTVASYRHGSQAGLDPLADHPAYARHGW